MGSHDFKGLMPEQMIINQLAKFCKEHDGINPAVIRAFCSKHLAQIWTHGDPVYLLSTPFKLKKSPILIPTRHKKPNEPNLKISVPANGFSLDFNKTPVRLAKFESVWLEDGRTRLGFFTSGQGHKARHEAGEPDQQTEAPAVEGASRSKGWDVSHLLTAPSRQDAWFEAIADMARCFYAELDKLPNEAQAWGQLWTNPPKGYVITAGKDKGEDCLHMPGEKPLSKTAFSKRWGKYTPTKPNKPR